MGYAKVDELPVDRKKLLTVKEAAVYTGIGMDKIRELAEQNKAEQNRAEQSGDIFVVYIGKKMMINRAKFDNYIDNHVYL